MVLSKSDRTGSGSSPTFNWGDQAALINDALLAKKLVGFSGSTILKFGHETYTAPIEAVTDELKRRLIKDIRDETTEFLFAHRNTLIKYRNEALKKIGETSFPIPEGRAKPTAQQPKLKTLAEKFVPFWKEKARPALQIATDRVVDISVHLSRMAAKKMGPHVEALIDNIGTELSYAKREIGTSIRDSITDEILDPTKEIRRKFAKIPSPVKAGFASALVSFSLATYISMANGYIPERQDIEPKPLPIIKLTSTEFNAAAQDKEEAKNKAFYEHQKYEWRYESKADPILPSKRKKLGTEKVYDVPSDINSNETIQMAREIASDRGISPDYAVAVAVIESKGDPNARNPNSNAAGVYQFIRSTANQYGLKNRYDPAASTHAFTDLTKDNRQYLEDVLGRKASDAELYLAHQQGSGGALALLSNPKKKAIDVLYSVYLKKMSPEKAKSIARNAVINNGGDSDMTASDFVKLWKIKYERLSIQLSKVGPS